MSDQSSSRATRTSYDEIAEDYTANVGSELAEKPLDRGLLAAFATRAGSDPIADIGSGPGHVGGYLVSLGARVVASDLSVQMCRAGASREGFGFVAADMTMLPFASGSLGGLVCFYAVIHLDEQSRAQAYREFARVLRPGGQALVAFHTSDAETTRGSARHAVEMMGHPVELTFHFLDPAAELRRLEAEGLEFAARLDRAPHPGVEHPSQRSYLLVQRPD